MHELSSHSRIGKDPDVINKVRIAQYSTKHGHAVSKMDAMRKMQKWKWLRLRT
jgi:hypothetical protein